MRYAHPEALVGTEWVDQHRADADVRLVEVDVDRLAYKAGQIPGAVGWDWKRGSGDAAAARRGDWRATGGSAETVGDQQRDDGGALRGQQQLVRQLRLLAAEVLRPRGRPPHERRPQQVEG